MRTPSPRGRSRRTGGGPELPAPYWSLGASDLLARLESSAQGLSDPEAKRRLERYGPNLLAARRRFTALGVLLAQFRNPLVLILVFAAAVSLVVREWHDAGIVLLIVLGSALLGFAQEYQAGRAVERLLARVKLNARVLRGGEPRPLPVEAVVPGDVVLLSAGSLVPADGVLLEAKDCFVSQAALTGEAFPVEKRPGAVRAEASLAERDNCLYLGTNVRSGSARMLVVATGAATALGQIAERLEQGPPETEFERGLQRFGYLLSQVMVGLALLVLTVNILAERPPIDSLLFAIALAVGLTPELLPAILSINLSRGARRLAARGVIVRRLSATLNLGAMEVLCTDKTGTLTEGVVRLEQALDARGQPSPEPLRLAYLNAHFQTGLANPLDEAIEAAAEGAAPLSGYRKLDEIPYDFGRKRLSVMVAGPEGAWLVTKGAFAQVLEICSQLQEGGALRPLQAAERSALEARYTAWSAEGLRVLAVAAKPVAETALPLTRADELELAFAGFLLFRDPPKPGVAQTLAELTALGVNLKVISGDNRLVTAHLAERVGLPVAGMLTGAEMNALHDDALGRAAERATLFVEVDPNQKERLIVALQKQGRVVGFLGDGVNDAPALRAADVGISVETAVDVAKEAADLVLLTPGLEVVREGVLEGRRTFANTTKYIFTTSSANFGNMLSMAGASLFLPFLPLLAPQILLNNFLSDIPATAIATDAVDAELLAAPRRWDIRFIRRFMILFGLVSSLFDFVTFGVLLVWLRAGPVEFRTAWFVESLLTELAVALVVRTRRPFFRSRPGRLLWVSTLAVAALALMLPYLGVGALFGFVPLPPGLLLTLVAITAAYVLSVEAAKRVFYGRLARGA